MNKNVGGCDKIARLVLGAALIAFALLSDSSYAVYGWVGVVPLVTGLIGFCPLYRLIGKSTCGSCSTQ